MPDEVPDDVDDGSEDDGVDKDHEGDEQEKTSNQFIWVINGREVDLNGGDD